LHRFTVALVAILSSALIMPTALADKPTREPLPASDVTIVGSCSFDVQAEVLVNKEFITTFPSGKQIITGRLVVRLTNLDNPTKSIVLQINGPGIEDLNSSDFNLSGTSLIFLPGILRVTHGPVTITVDESGNPVVTQISASFVDICAVLADP
jgi:hypothetical protein